MMNADFNSVILQFREYGDVKSVGAKATQPQKVCASAPVLRIYAWQVCVRIGECGGASIYGPLTHHPP